MNVVNEISSSKTRSRLLKRALVLQPKRDLVLHPKRDLVLYLERDEECSSALYGSTSVYSHLMWWKIQQFRQDAVGMAPMIVQTRRIVS